MSKISLGYGQSIIVLMVGLALVNGFSVATAEVYSPSLERYSVLQQEAVTAFNAGQLTTAIDKFEQALAIADVNSRGPAINNLAATYMRRGNYLAKQPSGSGLAKALDDYRQAVYLFDAGWPSDLPRNDVQRSNTDIAKGNLVNASKQARISLTDASVHEQLGQQLRQAGQFREAVVEFAWATQLSLTRSTAWLAQGDLFNVLNQPAKAAVAYSQAVKLAGPSVADDWLVRLANMHNKAGNVNAALDSLNKVTAKSPGNVAALALLEQIWREEFNKNPKNAVAHANLASVFQKQKRFDAAALAYKNAEALAAQDPSVSVAIRHEIHLNAGSLYQQTGQAAKAQQFYEEVFREDPNNSAAITRLSSLFVENKEPARAVKMYSTLLVQSPGNMAWAEGLLDAMEQLPAAEQPTARAQLSQRFASNAGFQEGLAERLHAAGNLSEAIVAYRLAVAANPNDGLTWSNLGSAQLSLAKTDPSQKAAALESLRRAVRLDPGNKTAVALLAKAQTSDRQAETNRYLAEARKAYDGMNYLEVYRLSKEVVTQEPKSAQGWLYQGMALVGLERYRDSVGALNKAVSLDGSLTEAYYELGVAHESLRQKMLAKQAYNRYVALVKQLPAKEQEEEAQVLAYVQERLVALK
jgi:tetratricopeptide (TPR) repeat protein